MHNSGWVAQPRATSQRAVAHSLMDDIPPRCHAAGLWELQAATEALTGRWVGVVTAVEGCTGRGGRRVVAGMPPVAAAMPTLAAGAESRNKSCGRCEVMEAAPCQAESLCAADARLPAPLGATLRAPLTTHHRQAGSTPLWQHLPHAGPLSSPPSAGNSRADGRWGVSWEWRLGRGRGPNGGLLPGKHNAGARQRQYYSQSGCEGL